MKHIFSSNWKKSPAHLELLSKFIKSENIPEVPFPNCKGENGCRCSYSIHFEY